MTFDKPSSWFLISEMLSAGVYGKIATLVGLETWAYTGGLPEAGYGWSWSWLYSAIVGIWGIAVVEGWRIKERKLSVQFGTHKVTTVSRLRPEYLRALPGTYGSAAPATTAIDALNAAHSVKGDATFIGREGRIAASIPVILLMGGALATLLTAVFVFEAFCTKLYDGPGKSVLVSVEAKHRYCTQLELILVRMVGSIAYLGIRRSGSQYPGHLPLGFSQVDGLGESPYAIEPSREFDCQDLVSECLRKVRASFLPR